MVSADSYGIDYTGVTDVRVALAAAINAQPPGTTFTLHPGGLYLTTKDAQIIITAPQVTVDGLGASIFRNERRTSLGSSVNEDMLTISASNVTVRNLKIYGFRKDEYLGSVLTTVTGTPTVNGSTIELNALNEEVRLPKVGLDLDQADNSLPDNPSSTHPHPATNYETPFYFRQVDGLLKFEAVLSDSNQVTNDCVFAIVNDLTDAVIYSQTYTLTGTPTLKTLTFDPTSTYLGVPMRITVRKATATANTITVTSITPYGEIGYRDRDGQYTYGYFTGGQEFSDAIQVNAVSGTLLEDIEIEGPDGDCVNCANADSNTIIRRVTGRGCGRQGGVIHKGVNTLIEDCTFRETGRSGLDLEPNNVTDLMSNGIIRRIEFINIRNYAMSMRHWAKILDFTISDITITNAGMGPWYGGGRNMVASNIVHSGTTRTEADRVRNGGVSPALNGGVGADAQVFGSNMTITGFTTELGFQLPLITNTYNDGSGVVTYSPSDIHIYDAVVSDPYTTPFVYILSPNSDVTMAADGGGGDGDLNAFQSGGGLFADMSPVLYAPDVSNVDAQFVYTPAPSGTETSFQTDAFQDDAFQQSASSEGIDVSPSLYAPSASSTVAGAQFIYLSSGAGWDSDEILWDTPDHVWDEGNAGGIILHGPQLFTPTATPNFAAPLLDATPIVFAPSVAPKAITAPLISVVPFLFDMRVNETVYQADIIDVSPVVFEFQIRGPITPDLIDHSPELFTPTTNPSEITPDLIDVGVTVFSPSVKTSVAPDLIDHSPELFTPAVGNVISPAMIDAIPVVFTPSLERIFMDLIDVSPEVFEPQKINIPINTVINLEFADLADHSPELFEPSIQVAQPQTIYIGFIDGTPLVMGMHVITTTLPTILLRGRYDPVIEKRGRYEPVILKHGQNARQGS